EPARRNAQEHEPEERLPRRGRGAVARAERQARRQPHHAEERAQRADDRERESVVVEVEREEEVVNTFGRRRDETDEVREADPAAEELGAKSASLGHVFFGPLQRGNRSCATPSWSSAFPTLWSTRSSMVFGRV